MHDFTGRTAVITGAASGIGLALAQRAAAAGMHLVLGDVDDAGLAAAAESVDTEVATMHCDVSRHDDVAALSALADERFGGTHLLCNNAGVGGGGLLHELSLDDWSWVLGVNLWGVIYGVQEFLPKMVAAGEPAHIVNTASMAGHGAAPRMGPYSVSKYGVVALSETLRAEQAGSNVGVSVLCPGWVATRIHESDRNRPAELGGRAFLQPEMRRAVADFIATGQSPSSVADRVFDAVTADRFWIFTHEEMMESIATRAQEIAANAPSKVD